MEGGGHDRQLIFASAAAALSAGGAFATTYDYTLLDVPDSVSTMPSGINDSGAVVGNYDLAGGGDLGFIYSGETYTTLDYPGSRDTEPEAIADSGAVIGAYGLSRGGFGFLYSGGSDGIYTEIRYPNSGTTIAWGINASGVIAGDYTHKGAPSGFVDSGESYTRIKVPNSKTFVRGIDTSGAVAGYYINVPGSDGTYVEGINANGEVTGYYYDATDDTDFGFIATPQSAAFNVRPSPVVNAPEPSTWAMLLVGFAGLV
jgi:hypothetical protein